MIFWNEDSSTMKKLSIASSIRDIKPVITENLEIEYRDKSVLLTTFLECLDQQDVIRESFFSIECSIISA